MSVSRETGRDMPGGELPPLYRRLMGNAWMELDEAVRKAHLDGAAHSRSGSFRIRHGSSWLASCLIFATRLPSADEAVITRLIVVRIGGGEKWTRLFGDRAVITMQEERRGGLLGERRGIGEILFRLEASRGALIYRQVGAALRLGKLALPLPRLLWPRVDEAREEADGAERTHLSVSISLPVIGRLISYEGHLDVGDER